MLSTRRTTRKENVRTVAQNDNDREHCERDPKLSETFLLGDLSELLYEVKYLAKASATPRSTRKKKDGIAKLKLIIGRYRTVLDSRFKKIISDFITDAFKSRKISHQDLHKIVALWLRDESKSNN